MEIATNVFNLAASLACAIAFDWLAVGRVAAYYSDLDFVWWPVPLTRLLVVLATAAYTWAVLTLPADPSNASFALMIPIFLGLGAWGVLALMDINRQRGRSGMVE